MEVAAEKIAKDWTIKREGATCEKVANPPRTRSRGEIRYRPAPRGNPGGRNEDQEFASRHSTFTKKNHSFATSHGSLENRTTHSHTQQVTHRNDRFSSSETSSPGSGRLCLCTASEPLRGVLRTSSSSAICVTNVMYNSHAPSTDKNPII